MIDDEIVVEVRELMDRESLAFAWREGDILVIDNMLVAHSRSTFVGPRKIAGRGDRSWVTVIGQDGVGPDEDPVLDGHAVVDERRVLDLDPVAQRHSLVDERVAADHAIGADADTGPELCPMPDARARTDRDVGLQVRRRMDARQGINQGGLSRRGLLLLVTGGGGARRRRLGGGSRRV